MAEARGQADWARTAQLTAMLRTVFLGVRFHPERWTPYTRPAPKRRQSADEVKEGFANLRRFFVKG